MSEEIGGLENELYDHYSPDLFVAALQAKRAQLLALDLPAQHHPERAYMVDKLNMYIGDGISNELAQPTTETLRALHDWIYDQYGDLFDEIDSDGIDKYSAEQIVEYFEKAIKSTPVLHDTKWSAEMISRQKMAVSVRVSDKKIVVPMKKDASPKKLKELIVHEVFGHALRSAVAEQRGLEFGQHGTTSYTRFEEAFMMALEQCLNETYDQHRGSEHYIATGLSITESLSKEAIAEMLYKMARLKNISEDKENPEEKAHITAKALIRRTFAGMMDIDDGIAHRKDIDYYHGLNDAWSFLNYITEHDVVDEGMRWILSAKFNPMVASDRDYVNTSVPMPRTLNDLFDEAV